MVGLINKEDIYDIADAIREKTQTEDTFKPSEMGELIRSIRVIPENSYQLKELTVPTSLATFDADALPMPSLKVGIEPIQGGSGDPSPTNICPISGWDEVNVTRCGKNLFDATNLINDRTIDTNGDLSGYGGRVATPDYIPVKPNTSICLSYSKTVSQNVVFIYALYKDGTLISRVANNPMGAVIQTENANQIRFAFYDSISASDLYNIQLEYGNTATSYEPYNPNSNTYTIDLDGTRYGGTLDVVSGVLTVDRAYVDLGTISWEKQTQFGYTFFYVTGTGFNESIGNLACSNYKPVKKARDVLSDAEIGTWNTINSFRPVIRDDSKANLSATDFKTAMSGVQLVYELATPQTIQLTPTAVKSLLGTNNVWADTGDVLEGEYFKAL